MRMITTLVAVMLLGTAIASASQQLPLLPDPALTPGDVNPAATKDVICVRGYTAGKDTDGEPVRNVSDATRRKVFKAYNLDPRSDKFELDHLISLQLGGSNDPKNLWPQAYTTKPLNARIKDALENRLHALVCSGKLDLSVAQKEVATDWTRAYEKYVGPLPR